MTDREKLIELIVKIPVPCMLVAGVRGGKSLISASVIADHLLANGVTFATDTNVGSKWASVKDRLPEIGRTVLAWSDYWHCSEIVRWTGVEWIQRMDKETFWSVTHWMPLPEPPTEEEV